MNTLEYNMMNKIAFFKRRYLDERAQGIVEYALIIFFVVTVAIYIFYPIPIGVDENGRPIIRKLILSIQRIFEHLKSLLLTVNTGV